MPHKIGVMGIFWFFSGRDLVTLGDRNFAKRSRKLAVTDPAMSAGRSSHRASAAQLDGDGYWLFNFAQV